MKQHSLWTRITCGLIVFAAIMSASTQAQNFITNGFGEMGDNTNFESMSFDGIDFAVGAGSFVKLGWGQPVCSEDFPLMKGATYKFEFYIKGSIAGTKFYSFVDCLDVDKKRITSTEFMYMKDTTTKLAQQLQNGDKYIYLDSASGWSDSGYYYRRGIKFWNYTNSLGYRYPVETYTRNWSFGDTNGLWDEGIGLELQNNRIKLRTPWAGGTYPVDTDVSQMDAGGTYHYIHSGMPTPDSWTKYTGYFKSDDARPGTIFIRVGWLLNYTNTACETKLCGISLTPLAAGIASTDGSLIDGDDLAGTLQADSSGNVGIGAPPNSFRLHINAPDGNLTHWRTDLDSGRNLKLIYDDSSDVFAFNLGGASALRLDSALTVVAPTHSTRLDANNLTFNRTDGVSYINKTDDGDLLFRMGANYDERMRITNSGNVGIGSASPKNKNEADSLPTRFHVKRTDVSGDVEVARFEGGFDADNTAAIVRINHSNDRGLYLKGGRRVGDNSFGEIGIIGTSGQLESPSIVMDDDGNVGIGCSNPDEKLTVKGKIHAEEIIVDLAVPADYVFAPDYQLRSLDEVEKHVTEYKHLPGIPSAKEQIANGVSMGQMMNKQLEKIEELTLYTIQQQKQLDELKQVKKENEELKKINAMILERLERLERK